jgi:hypothetical protein
MILHDILELMTGNNRACGILCSIKLHRNTERKYSAGEIKSLRLESKPDVQNARYMCQSYDKRDIKFRYDVYDGLPGGLWDCRAVKL